MPDAASGPLAAPAAPAAPEARPWRRAIAWLLLLGPFFFLSYGLANFVAAQRDGVPVLAFDWERALPFWAWTIVPYWSIDALYALSLFMCTTRRELDTHARRLLTAQIVAIACFVVAPHRYSFARPPADGVFGLLFDALLGFDLPYNQLPSLHIALAVILWVLYAGKLRGLARNLLTVWFMLIGASVLTTYQHHFVDLPTGFALGWLCVWLWPLAPGVAAPVPAWRTSTDPARHRVAALYALAAVGCGAVALAGGAWLWLLWPALSLALVALAYAGVGVAAFQKSADGRLSLAARWLFAPYRAGAWLNSRLWTWRHPAPVPLGDGVWLGRVPPPADVGGMPFAGIVDLTAEFSLHHASAHYASVPMLDLATPTPTALADAAAAIERLRARGPVLVCCALGYSRSACAAAAWLLASGRAKAVDDALVRVRAARAQIVLRPRHLDALRALPAPAPG